MPRDFPEGGQWAGPHELPDHLKRLHRAVMRDAGRERDERLGLVESDLDEDGRSWPGRVEAENPSG